MDHRGKGMKNTRRAYFKWEMKICRFPLNDFKKNNFMPTFGRDLKDFFSATNLLIYL